MNTVILRMSLFLRKTPTFFGWRKEKREYALILNNFQALRSLKLSQVSCVRERAEQGKPLDVWLIKFLEKKAEILRLLQSSEERIHQALIVAKEADKEFAKKGPARKYLAEKLGGLSEQYLFSNQKDFFQFMTKNWIFRNSKRAYFSLPAFFTEETPSGTSCADGSIDVGCAFEEFDFADRLSWSVFSDDEVLHEKHATRLHLLLNLCISGKSTEAVSKAIAFDQEHKPEGMSYEDAVWRFTTRAFRYKIRTQ